MFLVVDAALGRERPRWTAAFAELVDLEGDGTWCARAEAELDILVEPHQVVIHGPVQATVPRDCDRCLGHYLEEVTTAVGDVVMIAAGGGETAVFDDDTEAWLVGPEGRVDLTEIVRQAILLALGTRASCGVDCPGQHQPAREPSDEATMDPRWAVLQNLWKDKDDGRPEATDE